MRLRKLCFHAGVASLSLAFGAFSHATNLSNSTTGTVSDGSASIPYRLFQPTDISSDVAAGKKVPLILFLHGMGDRGTDNVGQTYWMDQLQQKTASGQYGAYVLAPQISSSMWFSSSGAESEAERLTMSALSAAMKNPNVDTSRIYITGVSMGSYGVWDLIRRDPSLFAAALPMSAGGDPSTASAVKNVPIWAFHAADDSVVPVSTTRDMVAAVKAAGGNVKYTELASGGHYIWPSVYEDASNTLYPWLFSQTTGADKLLTASPSDPVTDPTTGLPIDTALPITGTITTPVVGTTVSTDPTVTGSAGGVAVTVPEPASMSLVAIGVVGYIGRRRRAK